MKKSSFSGDTLNLIIKFKKLIINIFLIFDFNKKFKYLILI